MRLAKLEFGKWESCVHYTDQLMSQENNKEIHQIKKLKPTFSILANTTWKLPGTASIFLIFLSSLSTTMETSDCLNEDNLFGSK